MSISNYAFKSISGINSGSYLERLQYNPILVYSNQYLLDISIMSQKHTWHHQHTESLGFSQKLADTVANGMGSWWFIIIQTLLVALWMTLNMVAWFQHWDVYPFILLNLLFSTQAAYAAPIIMMSQNRQSERDRANAEADYQTNLEAKREIEQLQRKLNSIEIDKLDRIIKMLHDIKE